LLEFVQLVSQKQTAAPDRFKTAAEPPPPGSLLRLRVFAPFYTAKTTIYGPLRTLVRRTFGSWRAFGVTWSLRGKKPPCGRFLGIYARSATNF
jgi:hypothetical protein